MQQKRENFVLLMSEAKNVVNLMREAPKNRHFWARSAKIVSLSTVERLLFVIFARAARMYGQNLEPVANILAF